MKKILVVLAAITLVSCNLPRGEDKATAPPIVIPRLTETHVPTPTPVVVSPTQTVKPVVTIDYYVVQPGDTLTAIAQKFGTSVEYLAGRNSIADPDTIFPGQILNLTGEIEIPEAPSTGKLIIVKLSAQRIFVFQDGRLEATFVVSTGISDYPTRTGQYKIWAKLPETRMTGPGYDLDHVKWVMYFDEGRGFHAKYWNQIYGRPSSHGCVNMTEADAKWLYDWAEVGDLVLVIP